MDPAPLSAVIFENITSDDSRLDLQVRVSSAEGETVFPLWFEFNQPTLLLPDLIALALSTLCIGAYSSVHFDLAISERCRREIEGYVGCSVSTAGETTSLPRRVSAGVGSTLSFSGGFDSLAALSLMPDETRLVSLDFGGRFSRERDYFETFDTHIVKTNLVETGLHKASWSFMGIAAILTAATTHSRYITFGGIIEAGAKNLGADPAAALNKAFPPFASTGLRYAPYVLGLTEVGTVQALLLSHPERLAPSLQSLGAPGGEKSYRKFALMSLVSDRLSLDVPGVQEMAAPAEPHFAFGKKFAIDFLALYALKAGGDEFSARLVRDMPDSVKVAASRLSLRFYERANTSLYENFPPDLVTGLWSRLSAVGILPYTERDWSDVAAVREILAPYHPAVR